MSMDETFGLPYYAVLTEALIGCAGMKVEGFGLQSLWAGCRLTQVLMSSLLPDGV